jgi:hypothetical protein
LALLLLEKIAGLQARSHASIGRVRSYPADRMLRARTSHPPAVAASPPC